MRSCINCPDEDFDKTRVTGACRVCEILDGDATLKEVRFCNPCKVYMCEPCREDKIRRARAFAGEFIRKVAAVFSSAVESLKNELAIREKKKIDFPTDEFSESDKT